jgi:hypothetical protein
MANLYGTLQSEKTGKVTRTANNIIQATAQSWQGSISVSLNQHGVVQISVGEGSTDSPDRLIVCTGIENFLDSTVKLTSLKER